MKREPLNRRNSLTVFQNKLYFIINNKNDIRRIINEIIPGEILIEIGFYFYRELDKIPYEK